VINSRADLSTAAAHAARVVVITHGVCCLQYAAETSEAGDASGERPAKRARFSQFLSCTRTLLIVDEAHIARNTNTKLCVALGDVAEHCRYRLALTGSPVVNASADMAGIATVVGASDRFKVSRFWGTKCSVSPRALDEFAPHVHRVKDTALKLPCVRHRTETFALAFTPEQASEYNAALSKLRGIARRLEMSRAKAHDTGVALAVLQRLQQ
jgi:hypothetical protein